jgi:3-oxoadipate enol-lactonase
MSLPQYSRIMAETMANGTYVEISGAAHISNVDSSDAFNAHMLAFLRDGRAIPPDKPLP